MTTREPNTVLRQKAAVGREAFQARAMSPAKGLRLALAKSGDELFDLALAVTDVKPSRVSLDQVLRDASDETLLILLDGPDAAIGVMTLDIQILSGMIEMQTTAQVVANEAVKRPPTRTDAAMVAPLIDAFLAKFEENLVGEPDAYWVTGFRFGVRVDDLRMLGLALDAPQYNVMKMIVDVSSGAKTGEISLILPVKVPPHQIDDEAEISATLSAQLGEILMRVPTEINAVLHRMSMPLADVGNLKEGDVIDVPRGALLDVFLEASPKKLIAQACLGQLNGYRAVRLNCSSETQLPAIKNPSGMTDGKGIDAAAGMDEHVLKPNEPAVLEPVEIDVLPDLPDLPAAEHELFDIDSLPDLLSKEADLQDVVPKKD